MTAVATREREVTAPRDRGSAEPPAQRLFEPKGPTLEDAIIATWRELAGAERTACPVCSAEMSRAGTCSACGSELS
jgi:hypothetical protein